MLSSIIRPTGPTRKLREWGGMVVMMVPQRMSVSAFSQEWGDAEIFWGAKGQRSQHACFKVCRLKRSALAMRMTV
jgi:hypothetical protein